MNSAEFGRESIADDVGPGEDAPARSGCGLINHRPQPPLAQRVRRGEPGEPRADDGDARIGVDRPESGRFGSNARRERSARGRRQRGGGAGLEESASARAGDRGELLRRRVERRAELLSERRAAQGAPNGAKQRRSRHDLSSSSLRPEPIRLAPARSTIHPMRSKFQSQTQETSRPTRRRNRSAILDRPVIPSFRRSNDRQ
jgi:hypothetical protein